MRFGDCTTSGNVHGFMSSHCAGSWNGPLRGWTMPECYALDYEVLPENHEGMICVVMIRLMLRRLANNRRTRTYKTA